MHFINLSGYLAASVQIKPVVPVVFSRWRQQCACQLAHSARQPTTLPCSQ